jgi:hypothetical protein
MLAFRSASANEVSGPVTDEAVAAFLGELVQPENLLVAPGLQLCWRHDVSETISWEIFQGRLLDPQQTRTTCTFRSWTITQVEGGVPAPEPLLTLRWDVAGRVVYVTRALLCHAWEPYTEGNVILSRETTRWLPELVGSVSLDDFTTTAELRDELMGQIWLAVIGVSRLPLTSVEAPLPAYTLGQMHYVFGADASGRRGQGPWLVEAVRRAPWEAMGPRERAKLLEFILRATAPDEMAAAAQAFHVRLPENAAAHWQRLLRTIFNEISLSPYTRFAENALLCIDYLCMSGTWTAADQVGFLGWLLRQLGRHLTAYDLVAFHHRGANYPDALLLDLVLTRLLALAGQHPDLFEQASAAGRLRRRALRQGCLLRRGYEGHAVPDAPTSPGENARVLPMPFVRVPEDQLHNPLRRSRRLFADDPLAARLTETARNLLAHSYEDLRHDGELAELGMAVFIDRPLGRGKAATEPDQTLLLAHEGFSPAIAERRLGELQTLAGEARLGLPGDWAGGMRQHLRETPAPLGLPLELIGDPGRPVAALADARRVSEDFLVTRTLPGSLRAFFEAFDWRPVYERFGLADLAGSRWLVRLKLENQDMMALLDSQRRPRVLFDSDPAQGYRCRGGVETPRAGLRLWHVRDDTGQGHDLRGEHVRVV